MSKAEKTRQYIIEKTAPIFNMKGYAGTSLTDLTEATGLTKGSIYGNFTNKEEVATEVYIYNISILHEKLKAGIEAETTAEGKLHAFISFYRNGWKRLNEKGGCPILNCSVEADDNLPFLKKTVQDSVKKWANTLSRIMENGKKNGEIKDIDSTQYAYTICALIEGGVMLAKISDGPKHLYTALDRAQLIINQEILVMSRLHST